jgi:hypothetical protein
MPFDPSTDPTLLSLKRIAETGGDRGRRYDEGVLSVIEIVLRDGQFARNRMVGLLVCFNAQRNLSGKLLKADEEAELQSFIASRGWSMEQATEFLGGVDAAERLLHVYEVRDDEP